MLAKRLAKSKIYKEILGKTFIIPKWAEDELSRFDNNIGMTYDRRKTLCIWMKLNIRDWCADGLKKKRSIQEH